MSNGIALRKTSTIFCLIWAPGALAWSYLIVLRESCGAKLSNGCFGLKISKDTVLIFVSYDKTVPLQILGGALIRGGALNWQITVFRF